MIQKLTQLARVTDAVFQGHMAGLQRLAAEETLLRQALAALEDARKSNMQVDETYREMRALGTDLLWEAWIVRQRTALNMRLANLLVQKEVMRSEMRSAFGRAQVAQALTSAEQAKVDSRRRAAP